MIWFTRCAAAQRGRLQRWRQAHSQPHTGFIVFTRAALSYEYATTTSSNASIFLIATTFSPSRELPTNIALASASVALFIHMAGELM